MSIGALKLLEGEEGAKSKINSLKGGESFLWQEQTEQVEEVSLLWMLKPEEKSLQKAVELPMREALPMNFHQKKLRLQAERAEKQDQKRDNSIKKRGSLPASLFFL